MPDDLPAHWRPFQDAMSRGDGDAADRALAAAVQHEPDPGTVYYRISVIAYRTGNMEMSIASGLKGCTPPPANLELRLDLAMHLIVLGEGKAHAPLRLHRGRSGASPDRAGVPGLQAAACNP